MFVGGEMLLLHRWCAIKISSIIKYLIRELRGQDIGSWRNFSKWREQHMQKP